MSDPMDIEDATRLVSETYDEYVADEDLREDPLARLTSFVLRRLASEMAEPNANYHAELEYCDDEILAAARKLVDDNPTKFSGYPTR